MVKKKTITPFVVWTKNCKIPRWLTHISALILLAGSLIVVDGCAFRPHRAVVVTGPPASVVYVGQAPPTAMVEVRPERPAPRAVWIPGHWQWSGHKYVWVAGHWDKKPRGAAWVSGHWEKRARGWVWIPGRWR